MRIAVILNGISLFKSRFYRNYLPLLKADHTVDVFETRTANEAFGLGTKARDKRYDVIIPAGGDGTIHQVVNGILDEVSQTSILPVVAVLPLGSGNDFARSLRTDNKPETFMKRLSEFNTKRIDVGQVAFSVSPQQDGVSAIRQRRYFLNVVDVGIGPPVVRGVLQSGRAFGSQVAYLKSIVRTFFTYRPQTLTAVAKDWRWEGKMRTFAVANARYYGNGLCIAPDANLEDNMLDVFACGDVSVLDFILHSIPLKMGKKVRHKKVSYLKADTVHLSSTQPVELEADGEIIGWLPAEVKVSEIKLALLL